MALREIHTNLTQHTKHDLSVHKLADRLLAHNMAYVVNGSHHRDGNRVLRYVLDETAVDLDEIHRQMLEVAERGHPGPEIVQRKQAAKRLHFAKETRSLVKVGNRGGFRDLETDAPGGHRIFPELFSDKFKEAFISD